MSELELQDAILRNSLQLLRLSAGEQAKVEQLIAELERELRILVQSRNVSAATKAQLTELIAEAQKVIDPAYQAAAAATDTHAIAIVIARQTVQIIEDTIPLNVLAPTDARLASLTKDVLIDGAPSSAWWEKQAEDTAFKFAAQVRQGVVNGETNERIVARIAGRGADPGIMQIARRNARALVHSSVMAAANDARLATFRKNDSIFAGVRWLSTLDTHTCAQCAALDGEQWDLQGDKLAGTKVDFQAPPAHWNCRCVMTGVPKRSALEQAFPGISADLNKLHSKRAAAGGPVTGNTSFAAFLKRQSPAFVDQVLGKRRAALFESGRITLKDLVSGTGRELTLDEMGVP